MSPKILFLALVLATVSLWAQEQKPAPAPNATTAGAQTAPHPAEISAQDKARKNPVPFNEVYVARGKKIYATQCAFCHGDKGDGKGDVATDMKLTLVNFTKPETLKNRTDGELFAIIGSGADPMPGQAGRLSETQRWNLVNYLRALSGKVPDKATGNEPEENVLEIPK